MRAESHAECVRVGMSETSRLNKQYFYIFDLRAQSTRRGPTKPNLIEPSLFVVQR